MFFELGCWSLLNHSGDLEVEFEQFSGIYSIACYFSLVVLVVSVQTID